MSTYALGRGISNANGSSNAAAEGVEAPKPYGGVAAAAATAAEDAQSVRLTKREIEVLTLVIEGKSSKEVADQLFVSKRTVDFHLANIYTKLSVTNRVQAFREATRRGLIPYAIVGSPAAAQ